MEKLTKVNKMFIRILTYFFIFSFGVQCQAQDIVSSKQSLIMIIRFEDFFSNDTIKVSINKQLVIKRSILLSNTAGITRTAIEVFDKNDQNLIVTNTVDSNTVKLRKPLTGELDIQISLNKLNEKFILKVENGKYVGFSKGKNGRLVMDQRIKAKKYD